MKLLKNIESVFAYKLRQFRGKITQAAMAERLGTTLSTYQRWESGKFVPLAEARAEIALNLGVPETALFLDPDLSSPTAEQVADVLAHALQNESFRADLAVLLRSYMSVIGRKK